MLTGWKSTCIQILGLIENMSFFKCPNCGERSHIFSHGGARATAEEMGMDFLGEVDLLPLVLH